MSGRVKPDIFLSSIFSPFFLSSIFSPFSFGEMRPMTWDAGRIELTLRPRQLPATVLARADEVIEWAAQVHHDADQCSFVSSFASLIMVL